jgi:hypothetical protein
METSEKPKPAIPIFYVGKYKGQLISECTDYPFLKWYSINIQTSNPCKEALLLRLSELRILNKE